MRQFVINIVSKLGNTLNVHLMGLSGSRMLLGDVLQNCHSNRKTGLLNIAVMQSTRFLVRIYFIDGIICRLSFGPLQGREFLQCLDYYDLSAAVYLDGMKTPRNTCTDLPTEDVISIVMAMGKAIRLTQWIERR